MQAATEKLLAFLESFGPLWQRASFQRTLDQIAQRLIEVFNGKMASVWVPRNVEFQDTGTVRALNTPLQMAYTTFAPEEVNPFYAPHNPRAINQSIPHVKSRTRECFNTGHPAYYPRLDAPDGSDLLACSQPEVLRRRSLEATWCLPIVIRNLAQSREPSDYAPEVRLVVTIDGRDSEMVKPLEFASPQSQSDVESQQLEAAYTSVLYHAGRQIERAIWEEQDALQMAVLRGIGETDEMRTTAMTQICIAAARIMGFKGCTLFAFDRHYDVIRPIGTTGLCGGTVLASLGCSLEAKGPVAIAARAKTQFVAETGFNDEVWWEDNSELDEIMPSLSNAQVITTPLLSDSDSDGGAALLGILRVRDKSAMSGADDAQTIQYPVSWLDRLRLQRAARVLVPALRVEEELHARDVAVQRFRHDQKVPATAIRDLANGLAHMSLNWYRHNSNEIREELALIEELAEIMLLLSELSRISVHGDTSVRLHIRSTLLLRDIVRPLVRVLKRLAERELGIRNQPIEVEEESFRQIPLLHIDSRMVKIAFYNVIENALKYSFSSQPVRIFASTSETALPYAVTIESFGTEILDSEREAIFRPHYRGKAAEKDSPSGAGIGLSYARLLMRLHGGDLILSQTKPANHFTFLFPRQVRLGA